MTTLPEQSPTHVADADPAVTTYPLPFQALAGTTDGSAFQAILETAAGELIEALTENVDFVREIGADRSAAIRFLSADKLESGRKIAVTRDTPLVQNIAFSELCDFPAASVETGLTRLTMAAQEQGAEIARAFKLPRGETALDLPALAERAGFVSVWDPVTGALTMSSLRTDKLEALASLGLTADSQVQVVQTLAALQLVAAQPGDTLFVLGREAPGDFGQPRVCDFDGQNLSVEVAADEMTTGQGDGGLFVAPASQRDGSQGAWRFRDGREIDLAYYGALSGKALQRACRFGRPVNVFTGGTVTLSQAEFDAIKHHLPNLQPRQPFAITAPGVAFDMGTDDWLFTNPWLHNLDIIGEDAPTTSITSIASVTGTSLDYHVTLNVGSTSPMSANDYLMISQVEGTGQIGALEGAWKILEVVSATQVKIRHHGGGTFPTGDTLTSGQARLNTTILRWASQNTSTVTARWRGVAVETLGPRLKNIVIAGQFDPANDVASDGSGDGITVGTQSYVQETGSTSSELVNFGHIRLERVAVVEWPNNGIQIKSGAASGAGCMTCANGHRGTQAGSQGIGFFRNLVSTGNRESGAETETGGVLIIPDGVLAMNGGEGSLNIGGFQNLSGQKAILNAGSGFGGNDGAVSLINGGVSDGNLNNVSSRASLIVFGDGSIARNGTNSDTQAIEGGRVNGKDAAALGSFNIDSDSGAEVIGTDGKLILPASLRQLQSSGGAKWDIQTPGNGARRERVDTGSGMTPLWETTTVGHKRPVADGVSNLGGGSNRIDDLFLVNSPTVSSDARIKTDVAPFPDTVLDAIANIDLVQFRRRGGQRLHAGIIAQSLITAFAEMGEDAFAWGLVGRETWPDQFQEDDDGQVMIGKDGKPIRVREAGDLLLVRYEEFIIMKTAQVERDAERRIARLEQILLSGTIKGAVQ